MPGRSNALALDITFSVELAGFGDIACDLFEAVVCMENGAFRASGMMSRLAMEKALEAAGAPQCDSLDGKLEWARNSGRISSADQRCALVNPEPGRTGESDHDRSERALATAVRLAKKALSREMESTLTVAASSFSERWRLHASGPPPIPYPSPSD
jgi:hypothetical protein